MRPDLHFQPASGSAVAPGALFVSWSAPTPGSGLLALAGTSPGNSDLGLGAVPAGETFSLTVPTGQGRVFLSFWLTQDDAPGGPVSYSYAVTYWPAREVVAPETVVRGELGILWLEAWLGEDLVDRRLCPARVLGFVGQEISFSFEDADDVAPWTPSEVRASVGFALMRLREVDRFDDELSAGAAMFEGEERIFSSEYVLYALDFEIAVPSKLKGADPVSIIEDRLYEVERIFTGLILQPEGTPVLSIRNLARYPTRRRGGNDDGTWRRAFLTVQVRARVRRSHVGVKEVALP